MRRWNMDEKKQIEEMAKLACSVFDGNCRGCSFNFYPPCPPKASAERLYAAGYRKQSGWISVDERLPESGVPCLLCCDIKRIDGTHRQYVCDGYHVERWKEGCPNYGGDCAVEYNEEDDEFYLCEGWYEVINNWDDYNSIGINDTVTHWMPLPEPPKGE
jgi:hypothetical protein